jgi:hypothetical protein
MNDNAWGDMRALRIAAESLADAINMRVRVENRVRAGNADLTIGEPRQLTEKEVAAHPLAAGVLELEENLRQNLTSLYHENVPLKVREWASSVPVIASGGLFPRMVGLIGNPRHAVPLRMEGTGKKRRAVPDGEPYDRTLRQLWQWCGCGDPDLVPEKGNQAVLLRRGKMTTVRPLLFTFSEHLQMAKGGVNVSQHPIVKTLVTAKEEAAGKVHYKTCRNTHRPPMKSNGCGIVAHPEWGEPGSLWRPGHQQAHAFRIVQKELLRQYWVAAEGTEW